VYVVIRFWEPYTDTGYNILIHGLIHRLDYIRITILCYANIVMTPGLARVMRNAPTRSPPRITRQYMPAIVTAILIEQAATLPQYTASG
jgi:hypothetical protein